MSTIFYICLIIYMFSSIAFNISMFKRINHLYSYVDFLKTKLYEACKIDDDSVASYCDNDVLATEAGKSAIPFVIFAEENKND